MEPEKDGCFWAAVLVTVAAIFCWALAMTLHVGEDWVPWAAITVSVLAVGGMATRFALKNRGVVWTEEMKEEQRRRSWRLFLETIWTIPLVLSAWVPVSLVQAGILPQWAGLVLLVLLLVAWQALRILIRNSRAWKDLN